MTVKNCCVKYSVYSQKDRVPSLTIVINKMIKCESLTI